MRRETGHLYATDEDVFFGNPIRWSTCSAWVTIPMDFATRQMKLSTELMPKLLGRYVRRRGCQKARPGVQLSCFRNTVGLRSMRRIPRRPAGQSRPTRRSEPAGRAHHGRRQTAAGWNEALAEHVFSAPNYDPKLLSYLAASHWLHWGMTFPFRLDYRIPRDRQDVQEFILFELLNSRTLARLHCTTTKQRSSATAITTMAEHADAGRGDLAEDGKRQKANTDSGAFVPASHRNLQRMALSDLAFGAGVVQRPGGHGRWPVCTSRRLTKANLGTACCSRGGSETPRLQARQLLARFTCSIRRENPSDSRKARIDNQSVD